ncbi:MAG: hypothetical protein KC457_27095, partial [Myxococcales bacterium]|nr:hypothetical protein [Myxococcales bacterium]
MEADVRLNQALVALLQGPAEAVLVARSVATDDRRWSGLEGRVVDDGELARALRERGERVLVAVVSTID